MPINWEKYRGRQGVIDLVAVYDGEIANDDILWDNQEYARTKLKLIQGLQPIKSRQAAAIAIALVM